MDRQVLNNSPCFIIFPAGRYETAYQGRGFPSTAFSDGDYFPGVLTFLVFLAKTPNSGTGFLTGRNFQFSSQNSHFTGRKMNVNRRYWKAKRRGTMGVARSRGKERPF